VVPHIGARGTRRPLKNIYFTCQKTLFDSIDPKRICQKSMRDCSGWPIQVPLRRIAAGVLEDEKYEIGRAICHWHICPHPHNQDPKRPLKAPDGLAGEMTPFGAAKDTE